MHEYNPNPNIAPTRTVLHVDMNSYFATLLQQKYPQLRGKPIGITKEKGRSCLIAVSKEAKQFGVKTGCSLKDARMLCPEIQPIPAEFNYYLDCTRKLRQLFLDLVPDVYIYSLDEAFLELTPCLNYLHSDPLQFAQHIQARVHEILGEWVTCSIGLSSNRLLAKIGSEIAPPDSILVIDDTNRDSILATTPFSSVCGIGYRLEKKLRPYGITTPYQIRFLSYEELVPIVDKFWARELLKIAWGEEPELLARLDDDTNHMKSVGRSITGFKPCDNEEEIHAVLHNLTEEVTFKVRKMELAGKRVSLYFRGSDGSRWGADYTTDYWIRHTPQMFDVLYRHLYPRLHRTFPIMKFGVGLSGLKPFGQPQLLEGWQKSEKISEAIDTVNQKYGPFTIRSGVLTNRQIIYPEVTGFLGDAKYLGLR